MVALVSQKKSLQSDEVAGSRLAICETVRKELNCATGFESVVGEGENVYTVWKIKMSFRSLRIVIGSFKSSGKMCALSKKPVEFCLFNREPHNGSVYLPVSILNLKPVYSQSLTLPSHSFHS